MPETKSRDRTGYVMVELKPEDRAALEDLGRRLSDVTGTKVGLAGAVRSTVRAYRKNPDKFLKFILTMS